jgi:ankyrin repeat protein
MIELIDAGAPVNSSTVVPKLFEVFKPAKQGHLSPLAGAASNGQLDAVELLLAHGAVLNPSTTESASSPLHEACRKNDMDIVRQLLECGANVNSCNRYNLTPVMYAAKYSSPELLDLILSYHPDLEKLSFINTSVTHWSIWRGDAGMTEQIIKAGAGLHHRSLSGDTPLHFAVLSGSLEIISILLKYGADPYGLNGERKTPIDLAREHESWEILKLFHTQTSSR